MSALDTLRAATPTSKAVTMCVDGALQAEWDQALEALEEAGRADGDGGSLALPATTAAINHLDDLRDKVQASEVTFLFERMDPWADIALQGEHPPRDDSAIDKIRGLNVETYYPALIRAACTSVTKAEQDPEPIPDDVWASLLGTPATDKHPAVTGSLNRKQVNRLIAAAEYCNNGETQVPPSARSLLGNQDFGASLAQPSPGTSAPDGSEDGNRPSSPSTSTKKKARTKGDSSAL